MYLLDKEGVDKYGAPGCATGYVAAQKVWDQLRPWEKGWLEGHRFATSKIGNAAIEGYLRKRIRVLMEGK